MKYLLSLLILLIYFPTFAQTKKPAPSKVNKFSDPVIRKIYTLQDERKSTDLLPYLKNSNALYRKEAALAFASVQDKNALPALILLLSDKDAPVRRAGAYALGQIGDTLAQTPLMTLVASEKTPTVAAEMLEALGKCASQRSLNFLSTFNASDQVILAGLGWGIYRSNSKSLNFDAAIRKAVNLLSAGNQVPVRIAAAQFLGRTPKLDLTSQAAILTQTAQADKNPDVRMAVAQALGKVKDESAASGLATLVKQDPDYRVRINAIRALNNFDYANIKAIIYAALADKNTNTALAAADFLVAKATGEETNQLLQEASNHKNWRIRATLYGAVLKRTSDKNQIRNYIQRQYTQSKNIYEKGALLAALSADVRAFPFIEKETFAGTSPILASYGLQALADMRSAKDFPTDMQAAFAGTFKRAIESKDMAMIGIAATILQKPELNFKTAYPDFTFLKSVRDKLILPRDVETYQELDKTIRLFENLEPAPIPATPFNHPIDWNLVQTVKPNQLVTITTGKGTVTLQLFVEAAPGSVANFVALTKKGFFNGKNFHRVVPNFVVQGGDPRGDGWGGTDYSLRSEFANLRYLEGFVGMASAGKDTESCQWFITHSPTPHLDGRYTIFAKTIKGMDVVHQLEVGDKIIKVELVK